MAGKRYQLDMTRGSLTGKIIRYAIPLALTYVLQLAFHAADMVVIGRWGSPVSLAAIGATAPLAGLLINVFTGISSGANVLAAQYYGAHDSKRLTRMVHTTIALSIVGGIALSLLGMLLVKVLVVATDIPIESQPKSITYLLICFAGVPCQIIYNFGCAILRAVGNTRSPLYYLIIAGLLNVLLNMFMVIVCKMDVAGVAVATIISQAISAWLVIRCLQRSRGATRLIMRNLRMNIESLKGILRIGIPAGVQSGCFSISNIIVQSGINTFGVAAVAGMTAGMNLEMQLHALVFAFHHTIIAVVGQNYGAGQVRRVIRSMYICLLAVFFLSLIIGNGMYLFSDSLVAIFSNDPEVIKFGMLRAKELFTLYFILGFMDVSSGALRGLGNSVLPALSTIVGTCGLRIVWVKYIFPLYGSMESLLIVYPVSWGVVAVFNAMFTWYLCRKLLRGEPTRWLKPLPPRG